MKLRLLLGLCIALAAGLQAAVPVRWIAESGRAAAHRVEVFRGETLLLEPTLLDYGDLVAFDDETEVTLYWQTPGMGDDWWTASATTGAAPGRLSAVWHPTNDVGAEVYTFFLGAATPQGKSYRAHGQLRMRHAPGWVPNEVPLPVKKIDFAIIDVDNSPWIEIESDPVALPIATQALAVATAAATPADIQTAIDAIEIPDVDLSNLSAYAAGGWRNDTYWRINVSPRYRDASGAVTNVMGDVVVVTNTASAGLLDVQADVDYIRGFQASDPIWSVAPTNIASIDASGRVSTISPGIVNITASISNDLKHARAYLTYFAGQSWTSWVGATSNSVRWASKQTILAALDAAGETPVTAYWSVLDHANTNYVRNPGCWAADADLSGIVVSTRHIGGSWGNAQWHGTLISPRHIVIAKHTVDGVPNQSASKAEEIGAHKRFVGRSGAVYDRVVVNHFDPHNPDDPESLLAWTGFLGPMEDIVIGLLDAALPTNDVAVYPVLPRNYPSYLPNRVDSKPMGQYPGDTTGAQDLSEGGALMGIWSGFDRHVHAIEFRRLEAFQPPYDSRAFSTYRPGRAGDSGRPTFLWLPEPVGLVFMFPLTLPTRGTNLTYGDPVYASGFRPAFPLVDAILQLHGEALQEADFSGYITFGD